MIAALFEKPYQQPRLSVVHITTVPLTLLFLDAHVRHLRSVGYTVYVVASPGPQLMSFAETHRIAAHAIPMRRSIAPLHDLLALIRLIRLLRTLRPTIVHSHTPKAGLLGMLAAVLTGAQVRVYTIHGFRFSTAKGVLRALMIVAERLACSLANRVICVSHGIRDATIQLRIASAEKTVVLANGSIAGVDASTKFNPDIIGPNFGLNVKAAYKIPPDAPLVVFVGRIVRDKGIHVLAAAWKELRAAYPGLRLLLVGPCEDLDPIDASILQTLENDWRVHLTGPVLDTAPLYAAADVVCLPSYREGFPVVPLEAAAMRLPVVATNIAGTIEAVEDGVTGTLVPPGDSAALKQAIGKYVESATLRRLHGEAGRARVMARFRPQDVVLAYEREYRLCAQRFLRIPIHEPRSTGSNSDTPVLQ